MRYFLNNPPVWLARALGIVSGSAGWESSGEMFQTLDAVQGGWGMTPGWKAVATTVGVGAGGEIIVMSNTDTELTRVAFVDFINGTAANQRFTVRLRGITANVDLFLYDNGAVPVGTLPHNTINAGPRPIIVPPGFFLVQTYSAIAAGTITAQTIWADMPKGVNPQ